jgi:hypothetical protein
VNKCKYKLNSYYCKHEEDAHLPKRISWQLHQEEVGGYWIRAEMPMMAQCTKCKRGWPSYASPSYHDFEG